MPFMESLEYDDVLALMAVNRLAVTKGDGRIEALMEHPTLRNGITDDLTTLVAATGTIQEARETLRMLDTGYADIEVLSGGTELSPHLKISVVRSGTPRLPGTMRDLKYAVELVESLMRTPLPVPHIIIVFNDLSVIKGAGGQNHDFAIGSHVDNEPPVKYASGKDMLQSVFIHEIAHHFFGNPSDYWLSEAGASIFEYVYRLGDKEPHEAPPGMLEINPRSKCEAHDLKMVVDLGVRTDNMAQFRCNHYLGLQLFRELLETMGNEEFFASLRELYRLSLASIESGNNPGIAEVRQAFHDQSEIVEKHWSGKLNAPDNRPWDEGIAHQSHNLIHWDQHPTYDGEFVTFSGSLLGDAVLSSGTIEEANRDGYGNFHIYSISGSKFTGNISPPGLCRPPRDPGDTTALEFGLEGRNFAVKFRFPQGLGDPSNYFVDVWGFQDASRTPVIWPDRDRLGYARIRVNATFTPTPQSPTSALPPLPDTRNTLCLKSVNPALYRQIQELPWVMDGVTGKEFESIDWLAQMARDNEPAVSKVLDMPFLDTHEPDDPVALEALYQSDYHGSLNHILAQPVFRDGISDAEIPLVAFAGYISRTGGDTKKLERILAPGYANVETLSRGTELSPHMKVSIIRTGTEHQPWMMDAASNAVELIERVYSLPLPVAHVVMIISHESTCGCTRGFAFDAPLEWDQGKDTLVGNRLQGHIVHELAHTFHVPQEFWILEGLARVFEHLYGVEYGSEPEAYKNLRGRCEDHDIQMHVEKKITPKSPEWGLACAYYLGGELFLELLDHLGVEELGSRLKEIYLTYLHNPPTGRFVGIIEVRQVFSSESDIVEKYWSGKFNAPENRQ